MPFICIYVPDFPVEAIMRAAPELRDKSVAVLDGTPPLLTVIAASAHAREAGIEVGMTKLHAETCVGVHLPRRSPMQEEAAHAALLDCAHAFSPRVEDTNRNNASGKNSNVGDTIILDATGLDRLFGPPAKVAHDLASRVAQIGLDAHVAFAGNPDAAMHAARGFAGVTVIAPGNEAERLGTLQISLLDPEPTILETLNHWGIRNFHELAALPEIALSQRLGQQGLRLHKLAQARVERTLVPIEPIMKFEETMELEHPVELLEPLAFVMNRLLEQICARLATRALAANQLHLTLELAAHEDDSVHEQAQDKRVHHRTFQFPVPIQDSRTFLKLLQIDLNAHPPGGPISKVVIVAEPAPPRFAQSGLFLPRGPEPERLELTLARIRGITGEDRVGSAELLDTHAPGAFRMRPFRPMASARSRPAVPTKNRPTAMRMFRPLRETKVQMKKGLPVRVFLNGNPHEVITAAGPWRKSGGWWNPQAWTRDEWDVQLKTTEQLPILMRVYRDLSTAKWLIEGEFD